MVSLAGSLTQECYRRLHTKAATLKWQEDWNNDYRDAMNHIGMLFYQQRGEPIVLGEVIFEGERAEAFDRLYRDTVDKTAGLIKDHWPAVRRVAEALLADRLLTQAPISTR